MLGEILSVVWLLLLGYAMGKSPPSNEVASARQGRFFPFYTIGRFQNSVCTGGNNLLGTCQVNGECSENGGISTGSCSTVTSQAVCCVYQMACGRSTSYNNTYFYNPGFPTSYRGGERCSVQVSRCDDTICQLRVDFLDFSLAQPNGDGSCLTDYMSVTGGSSRVPRLCGENTGQHVYIDFNGNAAITIAMLTTGSESFARHWNFRLSQIACDSEFRAPSGCLQYFLEESSDAPLQSFNWAPMPNPLPNAIGVTGTRQLTNLQYGICIRMGANMCSITYALPGGQAYAFTVTGDVGAIDPTLLGTVDVQSQACTTDYVIIPHPSQGGALLGTGTDRFCGLGLAPTTSDIKPFVLYVVQDGNENMDIANRGFSLTYSQNQCAVTL
ncbi:uncharacterized protein LOC132260513 [Phlebotomus argentipes]|uniref:uncharacterized protein LOC132260513 n=1 Tax=Phlebotomus argentipes TaxID=94469 RepID=UPI002892D863|nr:uncharacterized protein LOC132260513 [Phlebotomus argentipes]